jgi:hypothetical protein
MTCGVERQDPGDGVNTGDSAAKETESFPVPSKTPTDVFEGKEALAAVSPSLSRIPHKEVRRLTFEPVSLISVGLRYAELFREDRAEFEAKLSQAGFDVREYDDMEKRAKAFWYTDICYRQSRGRERPVRRFVPEARALRKKMIKAVRYLWSHDQRTMKMLDDIRAGRSHLKLADDLGRLAELFTNNWRETDRHCAVTKGDTERARTLGVEMLSVIPLSETVEKSALKATRFRAAEYLRRGIQEINLAAAFLFRRDPVRYARYPKRFTRSAPKKTKRTSK